MFALGVILALVGAGVIVAVMFGGANDTAIFDVGTFHVTLSTAAVFLLGALALLLLFVGLQLVRTGLRIAARRRREAKELNRLSAELQAAREEEESRAMEPKHVDQPAHHKTVVDKE
ncbi:MAG TPA: hypothetical protein VF049_20365 [Nocardioidaceae bacterium]|jgi:uncharacterized membrane protein YciS (DUF1049 family)